MNNEYLGIGFFTVLFGLLYWWDSLGFIHIF